MGTKCYFKNNVQLLAINTVNKQNNKVRKTDKY